MPHRWDADLSHIKRRTDNNRIADEILVDIIESRCYSNITNCNRHDYNEIF